MSNRTRAIQISLVVAALATVVGDGRFARGHAIRPGAWVVTVVEQAPVVFGKETRFVLGKDTELSVINTDDYWAGVAVIRDGKPVRGWVQKKHLAPLPYEPRVRAKFVDELASVPAEKQYIAFSLNAARKRLEKATGVEAAVKTAPSPEEGIPGDGEVACLGGITYVRGLVADPKTGDAIVVGQYVPGRQRLTLDDLAVALRARFVHGQWPVVSIDPPPTRREPVYHNVRFEGGVRDTAFGLTLFEADYLLKKTAQGHVATGVAEVPSEWDLWVDQAQRQYGGRDVNIGGRVWFFPILGATPVRENVAAYSGLKVGVFYEVLSASIGGRRVQDLTEIKSPTGEQFVAQIREHYEPLAAMHASWRRIQQLNELVALTRAIEVMEHRPDLSWWLESYAVTPVETPRQAKELSRSQTIRARSYRVSMEGGVELRAMALRLEAGDVSALADAALSTRPAPDALTWGFVVDDWVIPLPSGEITQGAEVTPQFVYAQFLTRQGKYEEALARCDKILAVEPNYLDALLLKGMLLSDHLNRQQDAIECFDTLLRKLPESTEALVGRALAQAKTSNFFEAIEDFDKALQINPKLSSALAYRGVCHGECGDYAEAVSDLSAALRLDPGQAVSYAWRGNIYRAQGQAEKALNDFNEAIRRDAKLAFAYASRGRLRQEQHELQQAITDLGEAIRLEPSDLSYYLTRAQVLAESDKHAEAVTDYSEILNRDANQTEARWQRSQLYRKLRQFDKALADCEKLNLLLVQVTSESAPLRAGGKSAGTVSQGDELEVIRVDGSGLWVEAVLASGDIVQGWIDQKHVR